MVKPAYDTEVRAGLLVDQKPIPLKGVSVEASIKDFCSRVTLTQRYCNEESNPVEAVYVFPVDETAAVCGFEALIDDARRKNAFGLLMSLNMLIEFGDAFDYSGADFKQWCSEVGFDRSRMRRCSLGLTKR